jgi:hypothetical protein
MKAAWPEPTAAELASLVIHVTEWGDRSREQQAICLAVLRGYQRIPDIAHYLGLGDRGVAAAVADLIGQGLLWDDHRLLLH